MRALWKRFPLHGLMISPFVGLVTVFYLAPVAVIIAMAFTNMDYAMSWNFVGLANFHAIFSDPAIWEVVRNTVVYVASTLLFNVGLALGLALLTTYFIEKEPVSMAFRAIWMLPRISPPVIYVLLWQWLFDSSNYGLLNRIVGLFGIQRQPWILEHPMSVIVLVNGLVGASFGMVIFSAAIKSIPQDYFRAARVDGATDFAIVRRIILPLVKGPVMFVSIWQTLSLLTSYDYILLLTNGGPLLRTEVWSLHAYHKAFNNFNFGQGAALAMVLVVVGVLIVGFIWKAFGFHRMMNPSKID